MRLYRANADARLDGNRPSPLHEPRFAAEERVWMQFSLLAAPPLSASLPYS